MLERGEGIAANKLVQGWVQGLWKCGALLRGHSALLLLLLLRLLLRLRLRLCLRLRLQPCL